MESNTLLSLYYKPAAHYVVSHQFLVQPGHRNAPPHCPFLNRGAGLLLLKLIVPVPFPPSPGSISVTTSMPTTTVKAETAVPRGPKTMPRALTALTTLPGATSAPNRGGSAVQ